MYKITETELREIKRTLQQLSFKLALLDKDSFFIPNEYSSAKKIIKSLEENYNIK